MKFLRTQIHEWFAPHLEAVQETKRTAEVARKGLATEQTKMEAPLIAAEQHLRRMLLAWEASQEEMRRDQERALQVIAQARAETVVLDVAAALETEAARTGDLDQRQEALDLLAQPVEAPAVSVAALTPKIRGITYRDCWKAHPKVDIRVLAAAVGAGTVPVAFLDVNMPALNQYARATHGAGVVPGVRFWNDRQIAVTTPMT